MLLVFFFFLFVPPPGEVTPFYLVLWCRENLSLQVPCPTRFSTTMGLKIRDPTYSAGLACALAGKPVGKNSHLISLSHTRAHTSVDSWGEPGRPGPAATASLAPPEALPSRSWPRMRPHKRSPPQRAAWPGLVGGWSGLGLWPRLLKHLRVKEFFEGGPKRTVFLRDLHWAWGRGGIVPGYATHITGFVSFTK